MEGDGTLSCGPERSAFEQEFAFLIGVDPCLAVATSSCTVALELATYLADLQPGDNVVVMPQSYQATINPLLALNVELRFGDVDANTLCLDPASVEPLIDDRTRAVYLTHYGGLMVDLVGLRHVLANRDVTIIEDCAHAQGSGIGNRHAGSWGNIACFSFQSMKNISTLGQGGMILVPNEDMAKQLRRLIAVEPDASFEPRSAVGELGPYRPSPPSVFTHDKNAFTHNCTGIRRHGTNSTLPEPAAAVGRVQLRRISEFLDRRRQIARRIDQYIGNIPGIRPQRTPEGYVHSHHLYTCFVESEIGNQAIAAAMMKSGVEIQQRYFPLHLLPEWRGRGGRVGQCPVAEKVWFSKQLNLPIYPAMTDDQVDHIAGALRDAITTV